MVHQVNHLYDQACPHCNPVNAASDELSAPLSDIYEDLIKKVHSGELAVGMIDPVTALDTAGKLMEAVFSGYGRDFETAFDAADTHMLLNLEKNVYHFSAAKNYQQLKDLTLALKDGDRIRSYPEFRREASQKLDTWVGPWLQTEYDTAVGSAQMASTWKEFQESEDIFPMATYRTAGDDRVRASHALLDGVTRPLNDSFWNTYWPPNGWACRCDVEQNNFNATPVEKIEYPEDVPKMFQVNLGKQGLVFPAEHPYYEGVPKKVLNSIKPPRKDE